MYVFIPKAGGLQAALGRTLHPQCSASPGFRGFVLPQACASRGDVTGEWSRRCQP